MSFRISDNKKLFRDIYEKNYADTVIGFAAEGKVLESKEAIENYLQVRRKSMDEILKRIVIMNCPSAILILYSSQTVI